MKEEEKVTVLILVNKKLKWQKQKAKLFVQSFVKESDVINYVETRDDIHFETKTHFIRIIGLTQSPRGYRANFIIDFTGQQESRETADYKSTYNWGDRFTNGLNEILNNNGWIKEEI